MGLYSTKDRKPVSLADALFSGTKRSVLALLFGNPARSFYATEIIERVGAGSGAVQRELKKLADSGIVNTFKVGNQKHYQANAESPVFEELTGLIRKTVGLIEPIKNALGKINSKIHLALIFGSVASKSETATSDIDLLIVGDDLTLENVYQIVAPVEHELARIINPTLYSYEEFQQRLNERNPFLANVLRNEKVLIKGSLPDVH